MIGETKSRQSEPFWANDFSPELNMLWRGRWRAGMVEPARYLYDHELVFVTKGKCTVQIEDVRHEVGAGQYVIIPPDTYHVTSTEKGVYRNCIHFDWQKPQSQVSRPIFRYYPERPDKSAVTPCPPAVPQEYFIGSFQHIIPISALIETLFHRWHSGEQVSRALCQATLLEILILLMSGPKAKNRPANRSVDQAYAVRDLLDQQSESDDGIQALLMTLGFSYPHLCRIFRTAFGITPGEYRNAMRLERAKALLPDLKLSIAEIAYQVGFSDPGYFTRQFRKQNGVSPKTLREHLIRP